MMRTVRTILTGTLMIAAASVAASASVVSVARGLTAAGGAAGPRASASDAAATATDAADFDERDESRQSYGLAPGATLEINSVSGDVTVETAEISQAEVEIVRTARTREDLRCREFKVTATPERLRLDGNDERRECRNVHVNQTLSLRVPRRVNLDVNSVSGGVRVGELEGWVTLNSISGNAVVARAAGEARVNSVSGRVSINLSRLGGGVRVNSVSGSVDVGLPDGANADITVRSISGEVFTDVPGMSLQKLQNSDYEGRVGAGGTALTFNSISGNVRFHRASQ